MSERPIFGRLVTVHIESFILKFRSVTSVSVGLMSTINLGSIYVCLKSMNMGFIPFMCETGVLNECETYLIFV